MGLCYHIDNKGFYASFTGAVDSIQKAKLEELCAQEQGTILEADKLYLLSHECIAALDEESTDVIDLYKKYPYRLRVSTVNNLTDDDFRYIVEFIKPDGNPFINANVIGAYVQFGEDLKYTLSTTQYMIINRIQYCNNMTYNPIEGLDFKQFNFVNFAEIKDLLQSINAELDLYMKDNTVIVPKRLSINPKVQADGDVLVNPVILDANGIALPETKDFSSRFNRKHNVESVYRGKEGFYAIEPEVKEALKVVKEHHRIKKENAAEFLKHPETVFISSVFDFNIDDYSDRVIDIGEYKYKSEPNSPSGIAWLPEEGTVFKGGEELEQATLDITPENVAEIDEKIKQAQAEGYETIEVEGKEFPVTVTLISKVEKMKELLGTPEGVDGGSDGKEAAGECSTGKDETGKYVKPGTNEKKRRQILIISDNFAGIDYEKHSNNEHISVSDLRYCLNDSIELLQHQLEGLQWLLNCYSEHRGALLADDMGLGKTLQTLTFAAVMKKYAPDDFKGSVLIVAPVSLLSNWESEYHKFVKSGLYEDVVFIDSSSVHSYKKNGDYDFSSVATDKIILTTYETLLTYQFSMGKIAWSLMVLDEAQRIKNPTTLTTLAIKAMKYDFGLCLTGTPIENTWVDLWSIMDFAAPGYNLGSLSEFRKNYVHKLNKCCKDVEQIKALGKKLHDALAPLFLRRLKKELCDKGLLPSLPKKLIVKKTLIMPPVQRSAYESVVRSALDGTTSKKTALEVIAKLRDISLFPDIGTIDERNVSMMEVAKIFNSSARLKITYSEIVNAYYKNEKILIFVESRKMQRILKVAIERCFQIAVPTPINGQMKGEIRQAIVDEFNDSQGFNVLILSPLAAGVGLNIATANHVVHLSRHWNPAKEDQATDRAYRIGQTKDVEVCIPMAVHPDLGPGGSFDEKLDQLLDFKRQLSEDALFPVGDSPEDGLSIFADITRNAGNVPKLERQYYKIEDVDQVNGFTFERIVETIYNNMGYLARKTKDSGDGGADVVVFGGDNTNLLIQCKKTKHYDTNEGAEGVGDIVRALPFYENMHRCKFTKVVVTNAKDFTAGAKYEAKKHGVILLTRSNIIKMLKDFPVEKIYI